MTELIHHLGRVGVGLCVPVADAANAEELVQELGAEVDGGSPPLVVALAVKPFPDTASALVEARAVGKVLAGTPLYFSLALGEGDPQMGGRVLELARELAAGHPCLLPHHVNQAFPLAGCTVASLAPVALASSLPLPVVCGLVEPTDVPGRVRVSTGPRSARGEPAEVPARTAVLMLAEAGVPSVKINPLGGLAFLEGAVEVARAATEAGLNAVEPSGGINLGNVRRLVHALRGGATRGDPLVPAVVPHIFGAVQDRSTGRTVAARVRDALRQLREGIC